MSAQKPVGLAASLGLGQMQHLRKTPGPQAVGSPDTRIPESLPVQGTAKRSHPDFTQLKAYVRKSTKRAAMRKAEDDGHGDFSDLVQQLLEEYLRT